MNDPMLRPPEVMARTGLSRVTIWPFDIADRNPNVVAKLNGLARLPLEYQHP